MGRRPKDYVPEEEVEEPVIDYAEMARVKEVNDQLVLARVKEYEKDFEIESLSAIDRLQIRQLAKLELAASNATDELIKPDLTPAMRKMLADSSKSLIAEARQLADSLGMSRKRRLSEDGSDIESYIPQLHRDAYKFLSERAVAIVCPHCRDEKAHVEIKAGMILYHFAFEGEWEWKSKCPRCNKIVKINQDNYYDFRFDTLGKYEDEKDTKSESYDDVNDGETFDGEDEE